MADEIMKLFDDYATRFARGERPDVRMYLARAGDGADELGRLIDGFLAAAPPPAPAEEAIAVAEAWLAGEPPILELRTRRGLRRDEVVDHLIAALGLDGRKRTKVKRYYHELEGGLLDPRQVDRRVLESLAETLRARVADLLAWRPQPLGAEAAYFRTDVLVEDALNAPAAAAPPAAEEPDEIDRLFGAAGTANESERAT